MSSIEPVVEPPFVEGFRFARVEVDIVGLRLLVDGVDSGAEALQVRTLICLAQAWPGLLSKDQLIERVWSGRYVSDAAVHKTISLLRRQLREAEGRDLILTRHRLGYQLAQAPQPCVPAVLRPEGDDEAPPVAHRRSSALVAATPFRHLAWSLGVLALLIFAMWWSPWSTPGALILPDAVTQAPVMPSAPEPALDVLDDTELLALADSAFPGNPTLALQAAEAGMTRPSLQAAPVMLARLHRQAGRALRQRGDLLEAGRHFAAALALFEANEERAEHASMLLSLGAVMDESGAAIDEVLPLYRHAERLWVDAGDDPSLVRLLNNRAGLQIRQGRYGSAQDDIARMRQLAERSTMPEFVARSALLQGDLRMRAGEGDAADAYQSAYDQASREGDSVLAATAAQRLGRLHERAGEFARQRDWLLLARRHLQAVEALGQLPLIDYGLGTSFEREGRIAEAREAYVQALQAIPSEPGSALRIDLMVNIARLDRRQGDDDGSERWLERADREARVGRHSRGLASVLVSRGFSELGRGGSAVAALAAAREAEDLIGEGGDWTLQRNVLHLSALALVAGEHHLEAESRVRRLHDEAVRRDDRTGMALAARVEAMSHWLRGQFDQGYAAWLRADDADVLSSGVMDAAAPATVQNRDASGHDGREAHNVELWQAVAMLLLGVLAGWRLPRRRPSMR